MKSLRRSQVRETPRAHLGAGGDGGQPRGERRAGKVTGGQIAEGRRAGWGQIRLSSVGNAARKGRGAGMTLAGREGNYPGPARGPAAETVAGSRKRADGFCATARGGQEPDEGGGCTDRRSEGMRPRCTVHLRSRTASFAPSDRSNII